MLHLLSDKVGIVFIRKNDPREAIERIAKGKFNQPPLICSFFTLVL